MENAQSAKPVCSSTAELVIKLSSLVALKRETTIASTAPEIISSRMEDSVESVFKTVCNTLLGSVPFAKNHFI